MRYLLLSAIAVISSLNLSAGTPERLQPKSHARQSVRQYSTKAAEAGALWRSRAQKAYGWDQSKAQWVLEDSYEITYNADGLKTESRLTDVDGISVETYTYNDNGNLATKLTQVADGAGKPLVNSQKLSREYDSRLTSFVTFNDQNIWLNNGWRPSNNYKQLITRNADGNITLMERAIFYDGYYDPTYRLSVEYGPDGKAISISESELTYDGIELFWRPGETISDIEWYSTDGQIVSAEDLFSGANRISKATITDEDDFVIEVSATYNDDGSYTAVMSADDEGLIIRSTMTYTPVDANGSCTYLTVTTYTEEGLTFTETIKEEYLVDAFGLTLLEEVTVDEDGDSFVETGVKGEVTYDPAYGYPLEWIVKEHDEESGDYVNAFRAVYSDYVDVKGVNAVESELAEGKELWFNLQGMPVDNPSSPGLYIRKTSAGSSVVKK